MADRRAGGVPHVRGPGGGLMPRTRSRNGRWRRKRSDAGRFRSNGANGTGGTNATNGTNGRVAAATRVAA